MSSPTTIFLSEALREFMSHPENFLGRSEFRVVAARGGEVAFEVIRELKPRLAAVEHGGGSGVTICRQLKADTATREVLVLVAVQGQGDGAVAEARDAGADDVMVAPFTPEELLARLGEILQVPESQRRHVRALFGVSFDGKTVTGTFLGNTVNVSEGGMLIEADQELGIGDRLECRFFLPGDQRPVDVKGKVVRRAPEVEGQMTAFGVIFQSVSDEDMARIRNYVQTHKE